MNKCNICRKIVEQPILGECFNCFEKTIKKETARQIFDDLEKMATAEYNSMAVKLYTFNEKNIKELRKKYLDPFDKASTENKEMKE